ncbi:MazG-like family protein [Cohnella nanjingensis]|uniref:MazG-like family protein n=1 Tax=Cohnella nanjingensis TaxID=1387779 RepID=UPI001FE90DBF|nr:MazG-like family protein [Cohnella nanjingensis]
MSQTERDLDVAGRARLIEWLKSEVVDQVSRLFKAMWDGSAVRIADSLAGLIAGSYILGRRLGVSYRDLDGAIADKLAKLKQEGHQLEDHYQDLSALEEHIRKR